MIRKTRSQLMCALLLASNVELGHDSLWYMSGSRTNGATASQPISVGSWGELCICKWESGHVAPYHPGNSSIQRGGGGILHAMTYVFRDPDPSFGSPRSRSASRRFVPDAMVHAFPPWRFLLASSASNSALLLASASSRRCFSRASSFCLVAFEVHHRQHFSFLVQSTKQMYHVAHLYPLAC